MPRRSIRSSPPAQSRFHRLHDRRGLEGMAKLKDAGLTTQLGVAPGPANGFTLDLILCLERFKGLIDWAMIILNPLGAVAGPPLPSGGRKKPGPRSSPGSSITADFSTTTSNRVTNSRRAITGRFAPPAGSRRAPRRSTGCARSRRHMA